MNVSRDYKLTQNQRLQFLHNLFKGEALRYYSRNIRPRAQVYGEAISLMSKHFNTLAKQQRVKANLSNLKLSTFTEKEGGCTRKGLANLHSYIANRTPMCPPNSRHESNQVDFLRTAVLEYEWASLILADINENTEYEVLYEKLAAALQVQSERDAKNASDKLQGKSNDSKKPTIYYVQPRYAKKVTKTLFPGNDRDRSCWNCGIPGHRFTKCRKPINTAQIAARKAQYFDKKLKNLGPNGGAKRVLHEIALGVNQLLDLETTDVDDTAKTYFGYASSSESDSSSSEDETQEDPSSTNFILPIAEPKTVHFSDSDF